MNFLNLPINELKEVIMLFDRSAKEFFENSRSYSKKTVDEELHSITWEWYDTLIVYGHEIVWISEHGQRTTIVNLEQLERTKIVYDIFKKHERSTTVH